jgi:replication fork protection complex subunit Tof1/Swi1
VSCKAGILRNYRPDSACFPAIDFDSDDRAHAATYDPHFRLMLKLVSFDSKDSEAVDVPEDVNALLLAWHVPRGVLPDSLEASTRVIEQFLRDPFDLDGENAQDMLRKKRKQASRRRRSPDLDEDGAIVRRQPKQTEVQHFKSAAFIEDSDDDEEADRIFFAREAQKREANRYAIGMASMNPHGKKTSKKGQEPAFTQELALSMQNDTPDDSDGEITMGRTPSPSQPNSTTEGTPAPSRKPRKRQRRADPDSDAESSDAEVIQADAVDHSTARTRKRRVYGSQTDAESE